MPTPYIPSSRWVLHSGPFSTPPKIKSSLVTVGKDLVGQNQFFYPLLGSRLQNRLVYIPVSSADESRLAPAERYAEAEPQSWLSDLDRASVNLVVGLWPSPPEREWLALRPGEFEVESFTSLGVPWVGRRRDGPAPISTTEE